MKVVLSLVAIVAWMISQNVLGAGSHAGKAEQKAAQQEENAPDPGERFGILEQAFSQPKSTVPPMAMFSKDTAFMGTECIDALPSSNEFRRQAPALLLLFTNVGKQKNQNGLVLLTAKSSDLFKDPAYRQRVRQQHLDRDSTQEAIAKMDKQKPVFRNSDGRSSLHYEKKFKTETTVFHLQYDIREAKIDDKVEPMVRVMEKSWDVEDPRKPPQIRISYCY